MQIDSDLHIHGLHSGGVSKHMLIPKIAKQANFKGLDLVGTGDILNPDWREHVRENTEDLKNGVYENKDIRFLLTTEVEDKDRVHHLLMFPSFSQVEEFYTEVKKFSTNIDSDGRPRVELSGREIAKLARENDVLFGPCHAFTPWTAIYKEYDSIQECYGSYSDKVTFLELGLSADTSLADKMEQHHDLTFLSNSDCHSPWPHRLGREFNRFEVHKLNFEEIRKALLRKGDRGITLNVGLDPREGKYHCTACSNCYSKYSIQKARDFEWRCPNCGKSIKKGVRDRIFELADSDNGPEWRPNYIHVPPLAILIQTVVGHSSPTTKTVQNIWENYIEEYGSEIKVLVEAPEEDLKGINKEVGRAVKLFREEKTIMIPGGGGEYGELIIPDSEERRKEILEAKKQEIECRGGNKQKTISEF